MAKIKIRPKIPNAAGTSFDEVHFLGETSDIEETTDRKYVTDEQEIFLDQNLKKILLNTIITTSSTDGATNKVPSASVTKSLNDALGGIKFIISETEPPREAGKIICWINPKEEA